MGLRGGADIVVRILWCGRGGADIVRIRCSVLCAGVTGPRAVFLVTGVRGAGGVRPYRAVLLGGAAAQGVIIR